jgi:hypothetical protein
MILKGVYKCVSKCFTEVYFKGFANVFSIISLHGFQRDMQMYFYWFTEVFQMLLHYVLCCVGASGCGVKRGIEKKVYVSR